MIRSRLLPITDGLVRLPWWTLVAALLGVLIAWQMTTNQTYIQIVDYLKTGLLKTIEITLIAYTIAVLLGLIVALARISSNPIIKQVSTFYVEIVRGLPVLVLLLYVAFVLIPGIIVGINALGDRLLPIEALNGIGMALKTLRTRDVDNEFRVVVTLIIGYSAFLSEVFRAGIESVPVGQVEAARALGMGYWSTMRHVVLRQAFRVALPPLGNDFIAMLKDSSLASVLGVEEITRLSQNYASSSFLYFQTYNVLAYFYLVMTLCLSLMVKWVERRVSRDRRG